MSKFRSKCGYLMVMQTGEEDYEHRLIKDKLWFEQYFDFVDEQPKTVLRIDGENDAFDEISSLFMQTSIPVLKCPNCGRIYIDFEGNNNYSVFKPEKWTD